MSEKSKDLNIDVAYNTFGMGLVVGIGVGFTATDLVSSNLQSAFGLESSLAGIPSTAIMTGGGIPLGYHLGSKALESIKKDNDISSTCFNGYFSGFCVGAAIGASAKYLMTNPDIARTVQTAAFCATFVSSVVALGRYAEEKGGLCSKIVNNIKTKVKNILSNDKDRSKENTQEISIDKNKEQKQELEDNKIIQKEKIVLRDTLSKSQTKLVNNIENWAEKNHINDKNGNLLKFDETIGSTRDAMNQLVSEAKANGFKIKATEKPLSHTVQNNLSKNSNEAER